MHTGQQLHTVFPEVKVISLDQGTGITCGLPPIALDQILSVGGVLEFIWMSLIGTTDLSKYCVIGFFAFALLTFR